MALFLLGDATGPSAAPPVALPAPIAADRRARRRPQAPARARRATPTTTIDVRLDHAARTLDGRETIRWRNITATAAAELQFHLYWNAWRERDSTWMRERAARRRPGADAARAERDWGSIDVTRIRLIAATARRVDLTRHACASSRRTTATRTTGR